MIILTIIIVLAALYILLHFASDPRNGRPAVHDEGSARAIHCKVTRDNRQY